MGFFSKKDKSENNKQAPGTAPVGAPMGAPKPPMAPGMMPPPPPGAPMAAPKPPMAPGMMPPPPGAPMGAPKPPMAPGMMPPPPGAPMGAPKPPMAPGMMPPPPGAPKPPMAPGMMPPPPSSSFGPTNIPSSQMNFGAPSSNFNATPSFGVNHMFDNVSTGTGLETILLSKKEYFPARSVISNSKVPYDQFCNELTLDFFNSILHSPNLLEQKPLVAKIKKTLLFVLTTTKDLPDAERRVVYNAALRFIDFLKAVAYYPDQQRVDDEVVAYLPFLKEVAQSFSKFLVRNR